MTKFFPLMLPISESSQQCLKLFSQSIDKSMSVSSLSMYTSALPQRHSLLRTGPVRVKYEE